jgi:hypothetical protein
MIFFIIVAGITLVVALAIAIGSSIDTAVRRDRWRRVAEERRREGEERRAAHAERWSNA